MRANDERSARKIPSKTEKNGWFRGTVRFFGKKGKLLILALSRCLRFLLTLYAGLLVMLSLAELGKNTRLYALSLKTTKRAVKSFVFFYSDFCHFLISLPSLCKETKIS